MNLDEQQIEEFRRTVTNKYVEEVMKNFDAEKKICKCCGIMKPITEFYKHPLKDTITDICKDCSKKKQKFYEQNKQQTKYCKRCGRYRPLNAFYKHPLKDKKVTDICKECLRLIQKNYRQDNKVLFQGKWINIK